METEGLNNARQPAPTDAAPPPGASEPVSPVLIPDHQLLRRIGCGSYGEVWLARHTMGMHRAAKLIYRASFKDQRPFERELSGIQKFEPISRSHEGFVDVLHVGLNPQAGYFYYLMELGDDQVSGQKIDPATYAPKTLAQEISQKGKLPLQECVRLGLALSQALAELHRHELVHRDIKPSNIIFVNGVPKLADIGLVAEVNEARSYVGTEGFIPPEGPGAPPADVYSLGKVLYEACTGKDRKDFPELPLWWDTSPEHEGLLELNEVILQACQNEASKRYASARDMHGDLVVLENGKSVKRLKLLERRLTTLKRGAGIFMLVLGVLGAISYEVYREWRRNIEAHQRQVGQDVAYGNTAMEAGDLTRSLPYFADALRLESGKESLETPHRLRFGSALAQCPKLTQMWFLGKELTDGQFSPDGKAVLLCELSGRARIYDIETGKLYSHGFGQTELLRRAAYSFDGRFVATASQDTSVCIWDASSLERIRCLPHPNKLLGARFSPDGRRLVTACKDGFARVWDARTGQLERILKQHTDAVGFAAFSPDGQCIVTTSHDGTACIWNAETGQLLGPPLKHATWVDYACFSPDGHRLATACEDHKARLWEFPAGRRVLPDLCHGDVVTSVEFSPDGRLIVTASLDGTARLWLAETLQPLAPNPILRHGERVAHATFSPDSRRVLTTCTDGSVRIWDLAGCGTPPVGTGYACSADGGRLLGCTNGAFQVWDAGNPQAPGSLMRPASVGTLEMNHNGRFVLSLTGATATNRSVEVWEVSTGKALAAGIPLPNPRGGASLSDDGTRLATFGGRTAQVWKVAAQEPLSPPLLHGAPVGGALFSPDGSRLATRSGNQVQVWDPTRGQPLFPPLKHPVPVSDVEFSPDGALLVTCGSDDYFNKCYAQVWNAATGKPVGAQLKHGDGVLGAAFSPDSRRVVTASEDFTAMVWEASTGRRLTPPLQHEHQVQSARFSPDGKWVVTASSDHTVRVWSAETGDPLTPPLRHLVTLDNAEFLLDGRRVFTREYRGQTRLWPLPIDHRPAEDLLLLAQLLSGGAADSSPRFAASRLDSLPALWQRLRTKYPSGFACSPEEIAAWHAFIAEESEQHKQWFACVFHLERLLALRPSDPALADRLARAREKLAVGD